MDSNHYIGNSVVNLRLSIQCCTVLYMQYLIGLFKEVVQVIAQWGVS